MSISALAADERVADVKFSEDMLRVRLMDGREISVPLVWYPRLLKATKEQRRNWQIVGGGYGIHWKDVDEDLSSEGLLRGAPAPGKQHKLSAVNLSVGKKKQRTVFRREDGSWVNKLGSASKASSLHGTQEEAIKKATEMLQNSGGGELTVKGLDGRICSQDTIAPGNDPLPPKDREH